MFAGFRPSSHPHSHPWPNQWRLRHWKTEIVATSVEMLSGRKKKDYAEEATEADGDEVEAQVTDAVAV